MHDENKPLKGGPQEGLKNAKFRNRRTRLLRQLPQQHYSTIPKLLFLRGSRGNQKDDLPDRIKELPRRATKSRNFEIVKKCMMKTKPWKEAPWRALRTQSFEMAELARDWDGATAGIGGLGHGSWWRLVWGGAFSNRCLHFEFIKIMLKTNP